MRPKLRKLIADCWSTSITQDYVARRINSERSLQASFWATLNEEMPARTRRIFIEPKLRIVDAVQTARLYPDLVICNTKEVIAVIELKYEPRKRPSLKKDAASLRTMARKAATLSIEDERFRGPNDATRAYPFSPTTLFVWGGVYSDTCDSPTGFLRGIPDLEGRLLELHAITHSNRPPDIVVV